MTYQTIALIQRDPSIRDRVSACVSKEGVSPSPEQWVADHAWQLAARDGWADEWEAAKAANTSAENYEPGGDERAITDAMILTAVQEIVAAEAPSGE